MHSATPLAKLLSAPSLCIPRIVTFVVRLDWSGNRMRRVEGPPIQVLVCVNQRLATPGGLPCCADHDGQRLYERLHGLTTAMGLLRTVYVTRSLCLAWCCASGVTVVIHPSNVWLQGCRPEDAEAIFRDVVQPLLPSKQS